MKFSSERLFVIDALRGIAVIGMVIFHLFFILAYFGIFSISLTQGFFFWLARITHTSFLLLSGISLSLAFYFSKTPKLFYQKQQGRMFILFFCILLITGVTHIVLPKEDSIKFGILYCIFFSSLFLYKYIIFWKSIGLVSVSMLIYFKYGYFLIGNQKHCLPEFLYSIGIEYVVCSSEKFSAGIDYFPLIPWIGVIGIGVFLGKIIFDYKYWFGRLYFPFHSVFPIFSNFFIFLGQNSLIIYMVHVPILIGIVFLMLGIIQFFYLFF